MPTDSKTDEVLGVMPNDTKAAPTLPGVTNDVIAFEPMVVSHIPVSIHLTQYGATTISAPAVPGAETVSEGEDCRIACPGCGNDIDPDCCWCGTAEKDHDSWHEGHTFVSMGCTCGFRGYEVIPKPEEPVAEWDIL